MREDKRNYAWQQELVKKDRMTVNVQGRVDVLEFANVARELERKGFRIRTSSELVRTVVSLVNESFGLNSPGFVPFETTTDAVDYLYDNRFMNLTGNRQLKKQVSSAIRVEEFHTVGREIEQSVSGLTEYQQRLVDQGADPEQFLQREPTTVGNSGTFDPDAARRANEQYINAVPKDMFRKESELNKQEDDDETI